MRSAVLTVRSGIFSANASASLYMLLGGKARAAVPLYAHASGKDPQEVENAVREWMSKGYRHVRVQVGMPGYSGYGASGETSEDVQKMRPRGVMASPVFEPTPYLNSS